MTLLRKSVVLVAALAPLPALAQFTLDLNGPLYGQNTSYYCGAASAQMIMQDYPNPADNACFTQAHIYGRIQVHKQDNGFYTDPDGLRDTLMELNAPPAGGFSIFADTDAQQVMHSMLFWMAEREYVSAALINAGQHWVAVTGFETAADPRNGSTTLNWIEYNDPSPQDFAPHDNPCTAADEGNEGGMARHVTGSSWFANEWNAGNVFGTKWVGDFVAVVEPPERRGKVVAELLSVSGEPISPEEAIKRAVEEVEQRGLAQRRQFAFLREDLVVNRALLTNPRQGGYYIVIFENPETRESPGAVLINAYTGDFQEIGAFPDPVQYLAAEEAAEIALGSLRKPSERVLAADLVYELAEQIPNRYRPVWRVVIEADDVRVTRYVDQLGQVFVDLVKPRLGGD